MPVTLAAAMAVIPLRMVRRWSLMGSSYGRILCRSFNLDVGGLDDRPPLLGLGLVEGGEALGRLQLARGDVEAKVGESLLHVGKREGRLHGAIQLGDRFLRRALRRE